ncbi:MAG: hypothetical protein PHT59_05365 [Candidatus Omnitrophica bacterium]|nr:hypothetical protein [Candidatus Omnitrophota bacterium]
MCEDNFLKQKGIKRVIVGLVGEYLNFYCEKCGGRLRVKFLGHEMSLPKFESVCKCGEIYQFKSIITDIPATKKIEAGEKSRSKKRTQSVGEAGS